jgi:hypothetical protein
VLGSNTRAEVSANHPGVAAGASSSFPSKLESRKLSGSHDRPASPGFLDSGCLPSSVKRPRSLGHRRTVKRNNTGLRTKHASSRVTKNVSAKPVAATRQMCPAPRLPTSPIRSTSRTRQLRPFPMSMEMLQSIAPRDRSEKHLSQGHAMYVTLASLRVNQLMVFP